MKPRPCHRFAQIYPIKGIDAQATSRPSSILPSIFTSSLSKILSNDAARSASQAEVHCVPPLLRGDRLSFALTSKRSGSVHAVSAFCPGSNRTIVPCKSPRSSRKRM
jgi:hypothetical protein